MQMQSVHRLHLSDLRQDCHCVVNARSNRNVFSWRPNTLWSVKSWSSVGSSFHDNCLSIYHITMILGLQNAITHRDKLSSWRRRSVQTTRWTLTGSRRWRWWCRRWSALCWTRCSSADCWRCSCRDQPRAVPPRSYGQGATSTTGREDEQTDGPAPICNYAQWIYHRLELILSTTLVAQLRCQSLNTALSMQ